MALLHGDLTKQIIRTFHEVAYELGPGWPESVYANAMEFALTDLGFEVQREVPLKVFFRGRIAGSYRSDTLVNSTVLLEYKSGSQAVEIAEAQLLNYLRCTSIEVGLFLNFGVKPRFKRLFLTNDRKCLSPVQFGSVASRVQRRAIQAKKPTDAI